MNRTGALLLIVMMILGALVLGVLGSSWHSSANVAPRSQLYRFQQTQTPTATPTPTPAPSPSPSPGVTPTPVPEPEPVPSPTSTPLNQLKSKQEMRGAVAKYGKKAQKKVKKAMHERKEGTLKSGKSGKKVTSKKQAIAIGLSEARKEGGKVPKKKSSKKKSSKKTSSKKK